MKPALKFRCRRRIALVAVCAMLVHLVVAGFAAPAAFAAVRSGALPDGYSEIVICSGSGMTRIVIDADGVPVNQKKNGPGKPCPACYFTGSAMLAAIVAGGPAGPAYAAVPCLAPSRRGHPGRQAFLCPECRAPPVSP